MTDTSIEILSLSDEEILKATYQLAGAFALKKTIRYGTSRDVEHHAESVAEHVFGIIFLAHYFLEHEPSARSLHKEKVYSLLLFHDFAEIKHGDVVTYHKTKEDMDKEIAAAEEVFGSLPHNLAHSSLALWQEYEDQKTPESRFARAIDKLEPMFELLHPVNERSVKRLQITYDMHVENKFKYTKDYPLMHRFIEVVSNDMRARGVFWENK